MDLSINNLSGFGLLALWGILWAVGGCWIARAAFNLRRNEQVMVGLASGLVLQIWLVNLLSHIIAAPVSFWLSAGLVFVTGILFVLRDGRRAFRIPVDPTQLAAFIILVYIFTAIGRGLAIFDDYAHLPTTSIMAAGGIPPRFSLDPNTPYGYHYFLLLFAAQVMRIGNFFVWTALDISRGLAFGIAIMLVAIWTQRLTRSSLAGLLGGMFAALGMGTRWLLLLLPTSLIEAISGEVQMLGSAAQTAPDLQSALTSLWAIEGHGPFAFPFAYVNGIYTPGILAHATATMAGMMLTVLILLTFNRWRGWRGWITTIALMSSVSLLEEAVMGFSLAAWAMITLVYVFKNRTIQLPDSIWKWWLVLLVVWLFTLFQGGVWTEVIQGWVGGILSGDVQPVYQTIRFELSWPVMVSSHLGVLSLTNPVQLIAALLEIGPVILALPLIFIYGLKAFQVGRYYEAAVIAAGAITLGMVVIQFTGSTGVRDTSKLYSFVSLAAMWAVPVLWIWGEHRSDLIRTLLAAWGTIILFGGVVLFGIELIAAQKPINSTFISQLDKEMHQEFWDELEADSLIFDRLSSRGTTIFGRYTDSSLTWWSYKPEWLVLNDRPGPYELQSAGFDYLYVDYVYDYEVKQRYPGLWDETCMQLVREYHHKHTEDFRRLYDLRTCR